jgi:hypothetical protein
MTDSVAGAVEEVMPPDDELVFGVAVSVAPLVVQARGGLLTPGVLGSYSPAVGDDVALIRQDATWLALGATRGATPYGGPSRLIGYGSRASNSTAAAAEQSVLRVDDLVLAAGNRYAVQVLNVNMVATVANDRGNLNLRVNQAGTAVIGSPIIQISNSPPLPASISGSEMSIGGTFVATADSTTGSVLLTHGRFAGAGNISLQGGTQFPIELLVFDLGPDVGNTGVSL